jgi:hypothetical protein
MFLSPSKSFTYNNFSSLLHAILLTYCLQRNCTLRLQYSQFPADFSLLHLTLRNETVHNLYSSPNPVIYRDEMKRDEMGGA